jgi:regulator of sigma D
MAAVEKNYATPRAQTRALIEKMLAERQEMLVLLCKVSGLAPFMPDKPVKTVLTEFCQILVDYIASAHFGLYRRIAEGTERRRPVIEVAKELYPAIDATTQAAVEFNERYEKLVGTVYLETLHQDLSRLGEMLATRVDLEDRLISSMLGESPRAND